MPRRSKTTEPAAAESKVTKTAAIIAALQAHPDKMPKEIAELLQAQGLDVKPQMVSTIKSNLKAATGEKPASKAASKKGHYRSPGWRRHLARLPEESQGTGGPARRYQASQGGDRGAGGTGGLTMLGSIPG